MPRTDPVLVLCGICRATAWVKLRIFASPVWPACGNDGVIVAELEMEEGVRQMRRCEQSPAMIVPVGDAVVSACGSGGSVITPGTGAMAAALLLDRNHGDHRTSRPRSLNQAC